jgi:hypothetical protein
MRKSVWEHIIIAIGVVSGIMTIISFLWLVLDVKISKIQVVLDFSFIFGKLGLWIFIFALVICTSSIIFLYLKQVVNKKKYNNLLLQYNRILKTLAEQLIQSSVCVESQMVVILKELKPFFDSIFRKPVNIGIKKIVTRDGKQYVMNVCNVRDDLKRGNTTLYELLNNTLLYKLYHKKEKNPFILMSDHEGDQIFTYKGKSVQRYKSYMVLPINGSSEKGDSVVVGFLTLDSLESKAFVEKNLFIVLPLLSTIAVYLYLFFSRDEKVPFE